MATTMVCPQCEREFVCTDGHTEPHVCRSCHDEKIYANVEQERACFLESLTEAGIEWSVWNTGGYVMCYAIPITKNDDGYYRDYLLFSRVEELDENIGFCLYQGDNSTQVACWFENSIHDSDDPETVRRIMDWFVPLYEAIKNGERPAAGLVEGDGWNLG